MATKQIQIPTPLTKAEIQAKVAHRDYIADDINDPYPYLYETNSLEKAAILEEVVQRLEQAYHYSYKPWTKALPIEALIHMIAGIEILNPDYRDLSDTDTRETILWELENRGVLIQQSFTQQMHKNDLTNS